MSAFDRARMVEARSLAILEPLLTERHGRFVLTGKGRLSAYLQRELGDLMFNGPDGRLWSVEIKAEQRSTGNLFLETWSNRNLDDAFSHAERGCKVGWLVDCRADLLFYHFLDVDRLHVFDLFALKRWAFTGPSQRLRLAGGSDLVGRIYDFPEKAQTKYDQRNETCGRIVPLAVLDREMTPAPKVLHPRQLLLDLGAAA